MFWPKHCKYGNMSIYVHIWFYILVMLLGDLRQVDWFLPLREWGSPGRSATGGCEQPHFQAAQRRFLRQQKRSIITLACSEHWEKIGKNMWVKKGKNGILHDLSIGLDWGSKWQMMVARWWFVWQGYTARAPYLGEHDGQFIYMGPRENKPLCIGCSDFPQGFSSTAQIQWLNL